MAKRRTDSRCPSPDPEQFLELYEEVAPALYGWARLHIRPPLRRKLDPEDVQQEVCYRALERFSSFDPERGPFRAWLFGIGHNVLREALRGLRTRGESIFGGSTRSWGQGLDRLADEATSVSARYARDEKLCAFLDQIDELNEDDKRLLLYRGFEGRKHQEVAEVLRISVDNSEKRWQRLRKQMRAQGLPRGLVAS